MKVLTILLVFACLILESGELQAGNPQLIPKEGVTMNDYNQMDSETDVEDLGPPVTTQDLGNGRQILTFTGSARKTGKNHQTIEYSTTIFVEDGEIVAKQITEDRDGEAVTFASILNDSKFENGFGQSYSFEEGESSYYFNEDGEEASRKKASITQKKGNASSGGGAVVVVGQDDTGNVISI